MSATGFIGLEFAVDELDKIDTFIKTGDFYNAGVHMSILRAKLVTLKAEAKERYDAL